MVKGKTQRFSRLMSPELPSGKRPLVGKRIRGKSRGLLSLALDWILILQTIIHNGALAHQRWAHFAYIIKLWNQKI